MVAEEISDHERVNKLGYKHKLGFEPMMAEKKYHNVIDTTKENGIQAISTDNDDFQLCVVTFTRFIPFFIQFLLKQSDQTNIEYKKIIIRELSVNKASHDVGMFHTKLP